MDRPDTPIYFDTAATTRVDSEVVAVMTEALAAAHRFANPSSAHGLGQQASLAVAQARAAVAAELGCVVDEVVFTSGATESINLALQGIALAHADRGRHLVTTRIEHQATLACCAHLETLGFEVTYLSPGGDGVVAADRVAQALRPDTLLLSVMHTNNETGAMQPIDAIAAIAAEQGVLLHVDAAQAAGKFRIDLDEVPIDLLSLSAHKFHGPKGVGCLVIRDRPRLRLRPLTFGGGQEFGLRPGTLPTHQVLGLAKALTLAAQRRQADLEHVAVLKAQCIEQLGARLDLHIHGAPDRTSPYILNFAVPGIRSDALMNQTADAVAIASGAACSAGTVEPSRVLRAMGIDGDALYGAVRVSFDRTHTADDIAVLVNAIIAAVQRIQELDA